MILFFLHSPSSIVFEKEFARKRKTVPYKGQVWFKAEEHFPAITAAREEGRSVMIKLMGNVHLMSNIWGGLQKRYTGIHSIDTDGKVLPMTGVNLEDGEWDVLVENFSKIKDFLKGNDVEFVGTKRKYDYDTTAKMYVVRWYLHGKEVKTGVEPTEYFTEQDAIADSNRTEPSAGVHYPVDEGGDIPSVAVEVVHRPFPEETLMMYVILLCSAYDKIEAVKKQECEACQVNSDSQYDHFKPGNCLDDTYDFLEVNIEKVKKQLKVHELKQIFDRVRRKIGAPAMYSRLLAKCAIEYIESDKIVRALKSNDSLKGEKALVNIIRDVQQEMNVVQ